MFQIMKKERNSEESKRKTGEESAKLDLGKPKRTKMITKDDDHHKEISQNLSLYDNIPKSKLTRQQRMEIQKEKNRIAAQVSRDRQKKYVQELQEKIQELETTLSNQLCRVCKNSLMAEQVHEHDFFLESSKDQAFPLMPLQVEESEAPENTFYRDDSSISMKSIGQFLFIFTIILSISAFGASIESQVSTNSIQGRLMQEIENSFVDIPEKQLNPGEVDKNFITKLIGQKCELVNYDQKKTKQDFMTEIGEFNQFLFDGEWQLSSSSVACSNYQQESYLQELDDDLPITESLIKIFLDTPDLIQSLQFKPTMHSLESQIWMSTFSILKLSFLDFLEQLFQKLN